MSDLSDLFWQASLPEMKQGYLYNKQKDEFICLICGKSFTKGMIYPSDGQLYEVQKYVKLHIRQNHHSSFHYLLNLDKKLTGLTDHQKTLFELFYEGLSDQEIARTLNTGSTSTIRNHRFSLREKQKQAKVFLALMELLSEHIPKKETSSAALQQFSKNTPQFSSPAYVTPAFAVTEEENEKILAACFKQGLNGPLTSYPHKEKRKYVVLRHLLHFFDLQKNYTEKEINAVLKPIYKDYVLLRRNLIEYGFLDRTPDGSAYWVKIPRKELDSMDKHKELKLAYKQNPRPMGVFQIKNLTNGKVFLGTSMDLPGKLNGQRFQLECKSHPNKGLQTDWNILGPESFSFEILEEVDTEKITEENWRDTVFAMEEKWLDQLQPYNDKGYNKPKQAK
ncbi:DUF2087 domain-containing protein [Desulfitobacterium sp. Sab5]|uniref:DUF2087 domain-containing protein n=1 Tax=Desulfitobacterium nosdiversum TaxID=3375356 RepID=UPI003CF43039